MLPAKSRFYLLQGFAGTPDVIEGLLKNATEADFDRKPDPERFTIREVIGHLADWEGVWLERARRIASEDNPHLQGYDEGQWAIDHDYAHMNVAEQVARFRAGRNELHEFISSLSPADWQRPCRHDEWGPSNIEAMTVLVLGHDGYHTKQIADWLNIR